MEDYTKEAVLVEGGLTRADVEEYVAKPLDTKPDKKFLIAISISGSMLLLGVICVLLTFWYGIGLWGNNQPVGWGFGIVNFVYWIGIGHAGRLFPNSFSVKTRWRTGMAGFAETMTILQCAPVYSGYSYRRPSWQAICFHI
jgi:molybdopterin-containing oxidoreductase family membrane subunit